MPESISSPTDARPLFRSWFGLGAWVALAVFVLGRLGLEAFRETPLYDNRGMDAYSAVEKFMLQKDPNPVRVAFFGTSQSVWGIISSDLAGDWGLPQEQVRNLATEGGTPFDIWNLIRRNEDKLADLRLAIVEVNPFVLRQSLDSDPRVRADVAQHATWSERLLVADRAERREHLAEWTLPIRSVRRPLYNVFLNMLDPMPGNAIYPWPERRVYPVSDWRAENVDSHKDKGRKLIPAAQAAKKLVGNWKLSKLQDYSLRQSLDWMRARGVRVIFHELPVHPEVYQAIVADPALRRGHDAFLQYVDTLQPVPVARVLTPDPAACGLRVEHMADRTHCNEIGAHIYSHYLARQLHAQVLQTQGIRPAGGGPAGPVR